MSLTPFLYYPTFIVATLVAFIAFINNRPMPSLAAARTSNSNWNPSYRPVGLFFGGTSGIGQAMAEQLARQTKGNAHIILLGRNQEAAEKIIAGFPHTPQSVYEFEKVDASSMKDVRRVAERLAGRLEKVNYLVTSTGFFSVKGRDETEEGLDRKLAVHFYGRFKFVYDLVDKLEKAKDLREDAGVMCVFSAGKGRDTINLDDLGLEKEYSLYNAACSATVYNDVVLSEFAKRHPKISFSHTYPGGVDTPLATKLHWSLKYIAKPLSFLLVTPAQCAEYMWSPLWSKNNTYSTGFHRFDNHGEPLKPPKSLTPEVIKAVWDHAIDKTTTK